VYTVNQIAKVSGITPRTLRFYDEIGLLHPTRVGENGYRYYDEQALVKLQQILLYRKLELPLEEIKGILESRDYDPLAALENHRQALCKRIDQLELLKTTVEKTILFMKGEVKMTADELFHGFSDEQQEKYEKEAMQMYDPETVKASSLRWKNYLDDQKKQILEESKHIYLDMAETMPKGAKSPEAQACVERWRRNMNHFWTPTLEQLNGLGELYNTDPRFKANIDQIHPGLAEFFREAILEYVKQH
jgi:DNA-binding transcriptional MerR regulator